MASPKRLILTRLTELLRAIESSSKVLREFLEEDDSKFVQDDPAAELANSLGLPFQARAQLVEQASILRATCDRLIWLVTPPRHLMYEAAGAHFTTTALDIALKYDIATYIYSTSKADNREGIPVEDLALRYELDADTLGEPGYDRPQTETDSSKDVCSGIFANTIASSVPVNNPEFIAYLNGVMGQVRTGTARYEEFMKRRRFERDQPTPAAFELHYGHPWYSWIHLENSERGKQAHLALRDLSKTEGAQFLPFDYPFSSIAPDTPVVDVGGGLGPLAELILPHAPHLRYIVQDREPVVTCAEEIASPEMKEWMAEGKLKFMVHDFFTSQLAEYHGAIFILRNILHNWPDAKAVDILRALRESNPSKVLIIDRIVRPHLRVEAQTEDGELEIYRSWYENASAEHSVAVSSQSLPTIIDFIMSVLFGSKTRLYEEWEALFSRAGSKLARIYPLRGSAGQAVLEITPVYE